MKYGIYLPNFGPYGDVKTLVQLAKDAERAGWDGFFIWDHIAGWDLPMVDPWVALAAIATSTEKIRIGTTVTPLPRRRPWKIAREVTSIDQLSGGRLTLSVGIGGGEGEWDHLGEETDLKTRGEMLDEALEILVGLWSGEEFTYAGEHYQVNKARFTPTPIQRPRIPIWVGGFWPNKKPFRRAAKWDGSFPLLDVWENEAELALFEEVVQYLKEHRESDEPFDIVMMGVTRDAEDPEGLELVRQRAERGATWWLEALTPFRGGKDYMEEWPVEAMRERVLLGPPKI